MLLCCRLPTAPLAPLPNANTGSFSVKLWYYLENLLPVTFYTTPDLTSVLTCGHSPRTVSGEPFLCTFLPRVEGAPVAARASDLRLLLDGRPAGDRVTWIGDSVAHRLLFRVQWDTLGPVTVSETLTQNTVNLQVNQLTERN